MATSRTCPNRLKVAITVTSIFFSTFLYPSVGILNSGHSESMVQQSKMVLGSKPPSCVNKCLNCSPCMATLVIPSHQWKHFRATYHGDEDESYYLLSWKCKCGDKLFQP
ncbi:EPIDERMAL PATTERNING FACTOR-like protein 8 [Herrania umbratica]|uniref:Epidermal patterning factor-like protein n=1 Tax=Herrania umbratica TaxID=108875 RepID=A0A6J1BGS1_9ROSI|nr:EPIDERMAL PATTERNING FACTOR-like protein 8 [Herrania umbratica]